MSLGCAGTLMFHDLPIFSTRARSDRPSLRTHQLNPFQLYQEIGSPGAAKPTDPLKRTSSRSSPSF